jgi:hypothetical protein
MYLSRFALAAVAIFAVATVAVADEHWVFLGTYTGKDSKGIYRCKFDDATGKLSEPELAAEMGARRFWRFTRTRNSFMQSAKAAAKMAGQSSPLRSMPKPAPSPN